MNNKNYGKRLASIIGEIDSAAAEGMMKREKSIAFLNNEIGMLQREIKDQTALRNTAAAKNDTEAFRGAAKNIAAAEVEIAQYKETLAGMEKSPIMTREQAETFLQKLADVQQELTEDANKEVNEHVKRLLELGNENEGILEDIVMVARNLSGQAQGAIKDNITAFECGKARVNTAINGYAWREIVHDLQRTTNRLNMI